MNMKFVQTAKFFMKSSHTFLSKGSNFISKLICKQRPGWN